jgi:hypothetical protein
MTVLNAKGGLNFKQELRASSMETVKELVQFSAEPDPVHGDKPAQMVRTFADQALKILEMPPEADKPAAQGEEGVGSFLSKKLAKAGKNIAAGATAAASAAAEAAHEAGELAASKAEQARQEMERRQALEQQRAGNSFGAAVAQGGSVAEIVERVNTALAQERDDAVAAAQRLTAELAALQNGAMMQMHSAVLTENASLKARIAALEEQVTALTEANQAALAQAAAASAEAGAAAPVAVQEAVPPTADVDALLSGFGAPAAAAPAPTPAAAPAAPAPAPALAPAPAAEDAEPAAPVAAAGPTRAELAAQVCSHTPLTYILTLALSRAVCLSHTAVWCGTCTCPQARERARAQAKERAAAKKAESEKKAAEAAAAAAAAEKS